MASPSMVFIVNKSNNRDFMEFIVLVYRSSVPFVGKDKLRYERSQRDEIENNFLGTEMIQY